LIPSAAVALRLASIRQIARKLIDIDRTPESDRGLMWQIEHIRQARKLCPKIVPGLFSRDVKTEGK
jgi:hypothetical protein